MKNTPDYKSRFRILKGGKISLVVSALVAGSTMTFASPTGGQVTSGSAAIAQNGSITTINQSSNKASINWNSFSIAPSETVNFIQPSAQSVTLNRVIGTTQSLIQGAMNANGQVFLLNPNGVLFANGSQINVGGLVASTLNITDENFQAGNYLFEGNSQNSIINMGTITANNGYVAMMGKTVQNEGTIVATMGNVQMASGEKISLNLNGNSLVKLTIDQGTLNALVENKGLIQADGGQVYLTTQALNTILDGMVNNSGVIEAQSLNSIDGKIVLYSHGGTTTVRGTLDATGGFIETSGNKLGVANGTVIKAKTWLIDPVDITIESGGTGSVNGTADQLSISAATIKAVLDGESDVILEATHDINVNEALSWTSYNLTLTAGNDINVNAVMSATDYATLELNYGNALTMKMNTSKTAFDGKILFSNLNTDALKINTASYTIINDNAALIAMSSVVDKTVNYALGASLTDVTVAPTQDFVKSFNGLGNTITNLTVAPTADNDSNHGVGLFGSVYANAQITNLGLITPAITHAEVTDYEYSGSGIYSGTGAIVGQTIDFGGIVRNVKIINNFVSGGTIKSDYGDYVAGIIGKDYTYSTIQNNAVTGVIISGVSNIGGIVGYASGTTISNSQATGNTISAAQGLVGGLVGQMYQANIIDSYASGNTIAATSGQASGGLVGSIEESTITNSHASGNTITGQKDVGGLYGLNDDRNTPSTISNSFYKIDDTTINGEHHVTYGGIYSAQFDPWLAASKEAFNLVDFYNYTYEGTSVFKIRTIDDFKTALAYVYTPGVKLRLNNDLDFAANPGLYFPVLYGEFNGDGNTISNLKVLQPFNSNIGFVGQLIGGTIFDLGLTNPMLAGYANVGGIAGSMSSSVIYSTHVSGLSIDMAKSSASNGDNFTNIGGLVGYVSGGSSIDDSEAAGSITLGLTKTGTTYSEFYGIGGLVGVMEDSSLTNYYDNGTNVDITITATATDTADINVYAIGGLVGYASNGTIDYGKSNGAITISGTGAGRICNIGGLIGESAGNTITASTSGGMIAIDATQTATEIGGLVGVAYDATNITGSLSSTAISKTATTTTNNVGGLVGYLDRASSIQDSYSSGAVSGTENIGGLVGYTADSTITNTYSSGQVTGTTNVGGLVGLNYENADDEVFASTILNSFYNKTVNSTLGEDISNVGRTTTQLQSIATFTTELPAGEAWIIREISSDEKIYPKFSTRNPVEWVIYKPTEVVVIPPVVVVDPVTPPAVVENKVVNNVVTTIANSTTITPPAAIVMTPVIAQQPTRGEIRTTALLQTIMSQGAAEGNSFGLVGTTNGTEPVQTISMEDLQKASPSQGVNDIRVSLGQDSFVELVNGGVNLPIGVSQEFYVVNKNTNSEKKARNHL